MPARILDKRSREWKRRCEIVAELERQVGDAEIAEGIRRQIDATAELLTIAEVARARFLAGDGVTLDDVVRIERAASLAERRLAQNVQKPPAKPDLGAYLASRAA